MSTPLLLLIVSTTAAATAPSAGVSRDSVPETVVQAPRNTTSNMRREVVYEPSMDDLLSDVRYSRLVDCNGNGFPDSVDIADGTAADVNFNGIDDRCDPVDSVYEFARNDSSWFDYSERNPGASYFSSTFEPGDTIRIRYTVPSPGGTVQIDVLNHRKRPIHRIVRVGRAREGHYERAWDLRDRRGRYLPGGRYFIRLRCLGRESVRPVRWS